MKWKANVKFNQPIESASIWQSKEAPFVVIHKIHGLGKGLYLSCIPLGITDEDLHTEDFETAVKAAKTAVNDALCKLQGEYARFIADSSETEISRY